jgi:hypothetical protein
MQAALQERSAKWKGSSKACPSYPEKCFWNVFCGLISHARFLTEHPIQFVSLLLMYLVYSKSAHIVMVFVLALIFSAFLVLIQYEMY